MNISWKFEQIIKIEEEIGKSQPKKKTGKKKEKSKAAKKNAKWASLLQACGAGSKIISPWEITVNSMPRLGWRLHRAAHLHMRCGPTQ
jgi:hypothetical protein